MAKIRQEKSVKEHTFFEIVKTSGLPVNVRSAPNLTSAILARIEAEDDAPHIAAPYDSDWYALPEGGYVRHEFFETREIARAENEEEGG